MRLFDRIRKSAKIRAENAYYTKLYNEPLYRNEGAVMPPGGIADQAAHIFFASAMMDMTKAYNR